MGLPDEDPASADLVTDSAALVIYCSKDRPLPSLDLSFDPYPSNDAGSALLVRWAFAKDDEPTLERKDPYPDVTAEMFHHLMESDRLILEMDPQLLSQQTTPQT